MKNGVATNRTFRPLSTLAAAAWLVVQGQAALAQFPRPEPMTGIGIEYVEPKVKEHKPIYERLKQRKVLEEYKEFMAPLKLDQRLTVKLQDCGEINAWFSSGDNLITLCYDLLAYDERIIAKYKALPGFQKEDAVVASFVETLLHETGHAVFYNLDIPVFGREEDAADAIAAYTMLMVGNNSTRRLLAGTAHVYRASELEAGDKHSFEYYADEHGTNAQRFYNTLCIAHGSDRILGTHVFDDLAELLPQNLNGSGRRGKCPKEFLHVRSAFSRFVQSRIDQEGLKEVQAKEWILTTDGKDILPPSK
jgi:hypothetical protein